VFSPRGKIGMDCPRLSQKPAGKKRKNYRTRRRDANFTTSASVFDRKSARRMSREKIKNGERRRNTTKVGKISGWPQAPWQEHWGGPWIATGLHFKVEAGVTWRVTDRAGKKKHHGEGEETGPFLQRCPQETGKNLSGKRRGSRGSDDP